MSTPTLVRRELSTHCFSPASSMHQKHRVGGEVTNSLLCQVLRLWLYKDVWGHRYALLYDNCCVS